MSFPIVSVIGLPGAGKTRLAEALRAEVPGVVDGPHPDAALVLVCTDRGHGSVSLPAGPHLLVHTKFDYLDEDSLDFAERLSLGRDADGLTHAELVGSAWFQIWEGYQLAERSYALCGDDGSTFAVSAATQYGMEDLADGVRAALAEAHNVY